MNTLEALYFPGTKIYSASQFPIFLVFGKLHLLQPVEDGGDTTPDIFTSNGFCQAITPCPLGEDRDRFLHLIRDIRERRDDYASQLSMLTVAGLSSSKSSIEDSSRSIAASLLSGNTVETEPEEQEGPELWQERLTLALAELLDREEEEVAVQMAMLEDDEDDLFSTLQGELGEEEESLFDELQQMRNSLNRPSVSAIGARLKAWSKIYQAGTVTDQNIMLTHTEEAADLLLEKYQEMNQLGPRQAMRLQLPANIGWDGEQAVQDIISFRQASGELLNKIAAYLSSGSPGDEQQLLEKEWADTLETTFPATTTGRVSLVCYRLPDIPAARLLGKDDSTSGALLAVVRWPEE